MELLNFLYNIFLLLLYSVPLTLSFVLYSQGRKRVYMYACILFIALIVDNVIIYMTELLPWFSSLYDHLLLSVPAIKTILYAVILGSTVLLLTVLLKKEQNYSLWIGLVFIIIFQLYTPMIPNGPWKVWIYYFPAQFFMFSIGSYGIYTQRKKPDFYHAKSDRTFYKILFFYALMAVAITIEDCIVIFHFDKYTPLEIEIHKRSLTQDIMNIGLSIYAIRLLFGKLSNALSIAASIQNPSVEQTPDDTCETAIEPPTDINSKQYLFARKYQFTAREEEILFLLLENKNNQEISEMLTISIGTAKAHIHNIFQKLGIQKRQQLFDLYHNFESTEL